MIGGLGIEFYSDNTFSWKGVGCCFIASGRCWGLRNHWKSWCFPFSPCPQSSESSQQNILPPTCLGLSRQAMVALFHMDTSHSEPYTKNKNDVPTLPDEDGFSYTVCSKCAWSISDNTSWSNPPMIKCLTEHASTTNQQRPLWGGQPATNSPASELMKQTSTYITLISETNTTYFCS